jgi:hypothetical protein
MKLLSPFTVSTKVGLTCVGTLVRLGIECRLSSTGDAIVMLALPSERTIIT